MAITTYSELQTAILNWLIKTGDTDATTRAPEWIALAESEVIPELSKAGLRAGETKSTSITLSTEYTALPTGFMRARSWRLETTGDAQFLDYVAPQIAERWPLVTTVSAKPKMYTIQGNQLRVLPVPDSSYATTFIYEALSPLSVSNTTNWLLTSYPSVYLWASLDQAYRYYQNAQSALQANTLWHGLIESAGAADGPSASASALRMRVDNGTP